MVLSNSTIGAAWFHRVARLLEKMDHPPFSGSGEDGKSLWNCLATPQPRDLVGDRSHFSRFDANTDVGPSSLFLGGQATVTTPQQADQDYGGSKG